MNLYSLNLNNGTYKKITKENNILWGAWSPDGEKIILQYTLPIPNQIWQFWIEMAIYSNPLSILTIGRPTKCRHGLQTAKNSLQNCGISRRAGLPQIQPRLNRT